jgi:hypothetical protein
MATPFDLRHLRAVDSPLLLIDSIPMCASCNGDGAVTLSTSGALAYMRGASRSRLVWLSPGGAVEDAMPGASLEAGAMPETPRLSPDGGRIAVAMGTKGGEDIWIYQASNRTLGRLTYSGRVSAPEWTRDGHDVDYMSWDPNPKKAGAWHPTSVVTHSGSWRATR